MLTVIIAVFHCFHFLLYASSVQFDPFHRGLLVKISFIVRISGIFRVGKFMKKLCLELSLSHIFATSRTLNEDVK